MDKFNTLWTERYRPKTLGELCLKDSIKKRILSWGSSIPHLLFVGAPGCGKTTLARILVHDVLKCDYLYINMSDESGIDTVRGKISGFIQTASFDGNIKVVILDEIDGASKNAQDALRNMMESYADMARFILTGNFKHKIGIPLQSRCQSLDLSYTLKDVVLRCFQILQKENIVPTLEEKQSLLTVIKNAYPDIRRCISDIQKCYVDGKFVFDIKTDYSELVNTIWKNLQTKRSLDTRKFLIEKEEAFNSEWDQLLIDLLNFIYEVKMDEGRKKAMILTIADHLEKSTRVLDKEINVFACLLSLEEC
jgi:DNA polymerase III delta prime subunit